MTGKNIFNGLHFPKMIKGGKADEATKPTKLTIDDFETYSEAISYLLDVVEKSSELSKQATEGTIKMLDTVAGAEKKIANMRDTMVETVAQFGQMVHVLEAELSAMWTLILQLLHRVDYLEKKAGITTHEMTDEELDALFQAERSANTAEAAAYLKEIFGITGVIAERGQEAVNNG